MWLKDGTWVVSSNSGVKMILGLWEVSMLCKCPGIFITIYPKYSDEGFSENRKMLSINAECDVCQSCRKAKKCNQDILYKQWEAMRQRSPLDSILLLFLVNISLTAVILQRFLGFDLPNLVFQISDFQFLFHCKNIDSIYGRKCNICLSESLVPSLI